MAAVPLTNAQCHAVAATVVTAATTVAIVSKHLYDSEEHHNSQYTDWQCMQDLISGQEL